MLSLSRAIVILLLSLSLGACSESSGGGGGTGGEGGDGGTPAEGPGPLVDNTQWVPTEDGEAFFGASPEGSECELVPIDCPEFPWPEDECVEFAPTAKEVPVCANRQMYKK